MSTEVFRLTIEDMIFTAPDSALAVLRGSSREGEIRTHCGDLSELVEGESVTVTATPSEHPRHGTRWKVEKLVVEEPDTATGRIASLRSIRSVGQRRAELLSDQLGDRVFDEIEADPMTVFSSLPGVGQKTAQKAAASSVERRHVREVMRLLVEANLDEAQSIATRAVAERSGSASSQVRSEPYSITQISGVGREVTDRPARYFEACCYPARVSGLANHLGSPVHAPNTRRVEARLARGPGGRYSTPDGWWGTTPLVAT